MNDNAWFNEEIMKEFNKLVWRSYLDKLGDYISNLLIINKAIMHMNSNVINTIEKYDTEVKYIPSGMTSILRPFEGKINKPFKEFIRKKYIDYTTSIYYLHNAKIRYNKILNWISEIWWDDLLIISSMIIERMVLLINLINMKILCSKDFKDLEKK